MVNWKKGLGSAMSGASEGGSAGIEIEDAQAKSDCEKDGGTWDPVFRKCSVRRVASTPVAQDPGITVPQVRPVGVSRRGR
jgi:hypothetical protein